MVINADFASSFLRRTYAANPDLVHDISIKDNPALTEIYTIEGRGGSTVDHEFSLIGARGFSGDLLTAQQIAANTAASTLLTWRSAYAEGEGSFDINYRNILRSSFSGQAAGKALNVEMGKGVRDAADKIVSQLFGDDGLSGGVGVWSDTATGDSPVFAFTFSDPASARNFQVGDLVVSAATASGAIVGQPGFVIDVDIDAGYIQLADESASTVPANPGSWAGTQFGFNAGFTVNDGDVGVTPVAAYLPNVRATDTFNNVNRAIDSRLSGVRLTAAENVGDITSRIRRLVAKIASRSVSVKAKELRVVMNLEDLDTAISQLPITDRPPSITTEDGYEGISVRTVCGTVMVVGDSHKSKGTGFVLRTTDMTLYSNVGSGSLVELVVHNGNVTRLKETSNVLEVRTISGLANIIGSPAPMGVFSTAA